MFFTWPYVQRGMHGLGNLVLASKYFGTFIYGLIERALIPFGLHHVFYTPFWYTPLGGTALIDGNYVSGAQNIFFTELASASVEHFSVDAAKFMTGKFPFMIFGLPGAALAMYDTAKPSKKKAVGGLLLSAAITSMITGITEPIEFTFLFVAPILYAVHCVFAGLSFMLMHLLKVAVGMTFSGGIIDLLLFGVLQGNSKTNWIYIIPVGAFYAVIYYFLFKFAIKKYDLITPGREEEDMESKLYTKKDYEATKTENASKYIIDGIGGIENIKHLDCCATRLRVTVMDPGLIKDSLLKESGASGVIHKGNGVQIIYGPQVSVIKSALEDFLEKPDSDNAEAMQDITFARNTAHPETTDRKAENSKNTITLSAHMNGRFVPLENVQDEAFSSKVLGEGAAIEPEEGKLYSPCDGKVEMVFDTGHAVSLVSENGCEILLHIGIDTVKLNGRFFKTHVSDGQEIHKGDLLISFELDEIRKAGYQTTTPMIICNTDDYETVEIVSAEHVTAGNKIIEIK